MTDELDIQTFLAEARQGKWRPVNVLVGGETLLIERAARYLKKASVGDDGVRGFNDDLFHGQGLVGAKVVAAARTLPMMAKSRYVLVRDLEAVAAAELDVLADYLGKPSPSTCLVLMGDKLLGTTKLAKAAKSLANKGEGAFLAVEPLKGPLLERFVLRNPLAAPLLAASHAGLPPAFIAVAEHDPLRDEGLAYADALQAAGVPVALDRGPGLIHGYLRGLAYCADARASFERMCRWLAQRDHR